MAPLYPSYEASGTNGAVILGTLYGLVDGVICGALCLVVQHICGGQAVPEDVIPHLDVTGRFSPLPRSPSVCAWDRRSTGPIGSPRQNVPTAYAGNVTPWNPPTWDA